MEKLLKVEEVSELLGIPKGSVYNMVSDGKIPHIKLGDGRLRFRPSSLERWVNSKERKGRATKRVADNKIEIELDNEAI